MNEYVWIKPQNQNFNTPIGAHILGVFGSRIKVLDDDNVEQWLTYEEILGPMHPTSVTGVEDMIHLEELQEYSILRNLQLRYTKDLIYTFTGSILIAINPYKLLPIYDRSKMLEYRKKRLGEMPPHIYAVADHSYENMRNKSERRCIVISGESGAGKTESMKLLLQYFARIGHKKSEISQQIMDSNPILEAFGNAKTICNDNSSRFGKYIAINFTSEGSLHNVQIKHYLLEKSRIVRQNKGEQNYHIFYAILAEMPANEKEKLRLHDKCLFNYLNQEDVFMWNTNLKFNIEKIKSAMAVLNFSSSDIWNIFQLIAAILHFGNVEFKSVSISNTEAVEIVSENELQNICELLGIIKEHLVATLTKKTILTQGDEVTKLFSWQQAMDSRDAFAKKIYGNLFNFIVNKINEVLFKNEKTSNYFIGVLDIFGFEAFDRNSFEQLCINYANEKLQQFFIKHIFKIEQELYALEGIKWKFVNFIDNQNVLDLIETGPTSVLSIINDESKIPQGTDQTMLEKLVKLNSENSTFLKPKYKEVPVFGIQHFAGAVLYDVKNFLEKNYDACNLDIKKLISSSENRFLKIIFDDDINKHPNSNYKLKTETLVSKFKNSLDMLMSELNQCQPFFIRCIKPNGIKKPKKFDRILCCKQLRYSGLIETTKVREAGYPVHYDYIQFVQRYRILCPGIPLAHKADCKVATIRICKTAFRRLPKADYQLGQTKIFLKRVEELFLEKERSNNLFRYAVVIQKIVRGWLARRRLGKLKKVVLMLENHWIYKQHLLRQKNSKNNKDVLSISKSQRLELFPLHQTMLTHLQAYCRGYLVRKGLKKKLEQKKFKNQIKKIEHKNSTAIVQSFVQKYFHGKNNYTFSKKPMKNTLTSLIQLKDITAAKTLWVTILRYTQNMSEPKKFEVKVPVSVQLRKIFLQNDGLKKISNIHKTKLKEKEIPENIDRLYKDWLKSKTNDLEKLLFIVGHGINNPDLRDEIYCQICKAIYKNPSEKAANRAWNLLSSCTGCFPPTDSLLEFLKAFIREGPKHFIQYCLFRIHRTIQSGPRTQPPCFTEFEAIVNQKPIKLNVFLTNGNTISAKIDSATTANEMITIVAKNLNLTNTFGFSIILSQEMKHQSLGDGSEFVLDAIAQCEQYLMEIKDTSENMPWKLYLKKEMFEPWQPFIKDKVAADLICRQIGEGIKAGEYQCPKQDLLFLVSQLCYVEHGKFKPTLLSQVIDHYTPHYMCKFPSKELNNFKEEVETTYRLIFEDSRNSPDDIRENIINYARKNWSLQFTKFFNVLGSLRNIKSSFSYPEVPLVVGVNSAKLLIIDESNERRLIANMSYMEICEISRKEFAEGTGYSLKIVSCTGLEILLTYQSTSRCNLHELLIKIIDTLKNYSIYAISKKRYRSTDKSFIELEKGDLIKLTQKYKGKDLLQNFWAEGLNLRTRQIGHFFLENVKIIPTLEEPSETLIEVMKEGFLNYQNQLFPRAEKLKQYTLESYARNFFTSGSVEKNGSGQVGHEIISSVLWRYSREKLHRPLHVNLENNEHLSAQAVEAFEAILEYTHKNDSLILEQDEKIAHKIFKPALENDALKDEIYCQIMKQLTLNPKWENENKSWELMWLVTGLFTSTPILSAEVKKFLQSRRTIQAARECLTRFHKISSSDSRRHPPHIIEIEAVKHRPCLILYKVYFPDETHKFFQIHSQIKVKDFIETILNRMKINSEDKFNLYVHLSERIFALPKDYYLFDYFQLLKKWMKKVHNENKEYQLYFTCQNWLDLTPGCNKLIDLKFVYPQEYNKYIEGNYEISREETVKLAAILYKVYSGNQNSKKIQKILPKLIPTKTYGKQKWEIWQKDIQTISTAYLTLAPDDCKIEFLKCVSKLPTYGKQYFVAKSKKLREPNHLLHVMANNSKSFV